MEQKPKTLVVDDMATMRRIIISVLKNLGFSQICEAEDGEAALEVLRCDGDIGFVISDWNMPKMDGLAFLQAIKADPKLNKLPVMMLTAEGKKDNIISAVGAGASAYVVKPFTPDTLKSKIEMLEKKGAF